MHAWTPEVLDRMARTGDPLADDMLEVATFNGDVPKISAIFKSFAADVSQMPADAPAEFKEFVTCTSNLPLGTDIARAGRGAGVMLQSATLCALALLLKSLPSGYASPRLANVLHMTQNLEQRPYRRALGVLQMLVNISQPTSFRDGGAAVVTGQKLRLLHAGVRRVVRKSLPEFEARFGTAISQLDMVFTVMTFSVHVIDGLKALGVEWTEQEASDYFYLWQKYGELQGIDPEWMPDSPEDGRAFCEAYGAREFANATDNAPGVSLTRADLEMMRGLIPKPMRWLGLGRAPDVYMLRMLGEEAAARVGVVRLRRHFWTDWLVMQLPVLWQKLWRNIAPEQEAHDRISRLFFRTLIVGAWGKEVRFLVPENLQDLRKLA